MQQMHDTGRPVLIMAHGAGSSADFLARAFPARACGAATRYLDDRTGAVTNITEQLLACAGEAARRGDRPVLGGVSIGAHAAALACARSAPGMLAGAVLVMPAWLGPAPAGSPTAMAAAEISAIGAQGVLARLDDDPALRDDWVVAELRSAWRDRATLPHELAAAAAGAAPGVAALSMLRLPVLVVALADDPVHPLRVARAWSDAVPGADFEVIGRDEPAADLTVFGRRVGAWLTSRFSGPP